MKSYEITPTKEIFIFFAKVSLSGYFCVICLFKKVEKYNDHINWTGECTSMTTTLLNMYMSYSLCHPALPHTWFNLRLFNREFVTYVLANALLM